jgi:hypothetical protein
MLKPNDRPAVTKHTTANPRIFLVVRGEAFPRPGLESYFVDHGSTTTENAGSRRSTGVYCSCDKVSKCSCVPACTCEGVCSCVGHSVCSCNSHSSSGGGYGCRCAPVH